MSNSPACKTPAAPATGQESASAAPTPRRAEHPALRYVVYGPNAAPDGFAHLAAEWDELLSRTRTPSIFLTHVWQTTWWNYLGTGDLWIVAFRRVDTEQLVGIAPLYCVESQDDTGTVKRTLTLVGCIEVSDYLDLLIARGWEDAVYRSLWDWLNGATAPAWDVVDLCNLPEQSLTYRRFAEICQAGIPGEREATSTTFQVSVKQEDVAPLFELPLHYATYLQDQVEKKQRHEIRRKQRRAEREADLGFYIVDDRHSLEAEVDDFVALQRASREDKADFMTPEMRRFFTAAARVMYDAGYLRLFFLTIDGEKAAALFAFEYNKQLLLYNSGYDPDAHAQLSPGWVLLAYCIQYAIAVGCRVFDFMQGNEEYKYRFGSHDTRVMRIVVERQGHA